MCTYTYTRRWEQGTKIRTAKLPDKPLHHYHKILNSLILQDNLDECQRTGAICAFNTYDQFLAHYESIVELYDNTQDDDDRFGFNGGARFSVGSYDDRTSLSSRSEAREPTNILYVAVKCPPEESDQGFINQRIISQNKRFFLLLL